MPARDDTTYPTVNRLAKCLEGRFGGVEPLQRAATLPDGAFTLHPTQIATVQAVVSRPCCVVCSEPGTGQMTALAAAVDACVALGDKVVLASAYGRDARVNGKRFAGTHSTTIHSLLGKGGKEPEALEPGAVVVVPGLGEELSVADLEALVNAIPENGRLVVCGNPTSSSPTFRHFAMVAGMVPGVAVVGTAPIANKPEDVAALITGIGDPHGDLPRLALGKSLAEIQGQGRVFRLDQPVMPIFRNHDLLPAADHTAEFQAALSARFSGVIAEERTQRLPSWDGDGTPGAIFANLAGLPEGTDFPPRLTELATQVVDTRCLVVNTMAGRGDSLALGAGAAACVALGDKVVMAHATGKEAAHNKEKYPGVEATTVYRLIGWGADGATKGADNRLPAGTTVVVPGMAEMLEPDALLALVQAMPDDGRLVVCGSLWGLSPTFSQFARAAEEAGIPIAGTTSRQDAYEVLMPRLPNDMALGIPGNGRGSLAALAASMRALTAAHDAAEDASAGSNLGRWAMFVALPENQGSLRVAARAMLEGDLGSKLGFDNTRDYREDFGFDRFVLARLSILPVAEQEQIMQELENRVTALNSEGPAVGPRV